jgi:alkylation response protein AidB-like acyl-CoA dehydrogenase
MKLPKALGGAEADPATQVEVIEAVSRLEKSAGWSLMIGATTFAVLAAFAKDAAIERIFAADQTPTPAGALMHAGMAVRVLLRAREEIANSGVWLSFRTCS